MKHLLFCTILIFNFSNSLACTCDLKPVRTNPKMASEILSFGLGFLVHENGAIHFKFIACYNRVNCADLILPHDYDFGVYGSSWKDYILKLFYIRTTFESFEAAIEYDKHIDSSEESSVKSSFGGMRCNCGPAARYQAIEFYNPADREDIPYFSLKNKYAIYIAPQFKDCGCDDIFVRSYKTYQGRVDKDVFGFYYFFGGKLFFKGGKLYSGVAEISEIAEGDNCNPMIKHYLNKSLRVGSYAGYNFKQTVNLCKMEFFLGDN